MLKRKKLIIFDLDDTLITSDAVIKIYDTETNELVQSLTPSQYNYHVKSQGHYFCYKDFQCEQILGRSKFTKTFRSFKRYYKLSQPISIITARESKKLVADFFKTKGYPLKPSMIYAIFDPHCPFTGDIASRKKQAIEELVRKGYNEITFYDDNLENLKAAKTVENAIISTYMASRKKAKPEEEKALPPLSKTDFNPIKFTHNQLQFFNTIRDNFLTVCTGPAGTAKTFIACYTALDLIREGQHKKILLARPAVESGENLGFLPGTIDEKIAPYMRGYVSNMEKILKDPEQLKVLLAKKAIEMEPIAFMRSQTFDDTILILDEAQNADLRQIMLVVTRMGKNSRIVICGDVTQWDLKARKKDLLIFSESIIDNVKGCSAFQFQREDIVRNPMLIALTDKYESYKEAHGLDK